MPDTQWPDATQSSYETQLRSALAPPAASDPVVSPPVYGKTQSGAALPAADGQQPIWLSELNLDPRNRAAAAAGGLVVQADSNATSVVVNKTTVAEKDSAAEITKQAPEKTAKADLARDLPLPTRPVPPIGPPVGPVGPGSPAPPVVHVPIINWKGDADVPPILKGDVATMPHEFVFPSDEAALAVVQTNFRNAATTINTYLNIADAPVADLPSLNSLPTLEATRTALSAALDPQLTIKARIGARVPLGTGSDPLQPLRGSPRFPHAMYAPLAELSPEWMLPGISSIPQNSAVLLQTNPGFIEGYMVGLNEDFARELLWQQFPAERNDTWFQNFWTDGGTPEIPPIAQFDPGGHLGDHTADQGAAAKTVLLVRGDLFRRYPNTLVSACQLNSDGTLGTRHWPVFRGQISDDCNFFAFDITDPINAANSSGGKPGWYFVLEEHITEPRFGLEPSGNTVPANPSWNDLGWDQVTPTGNFLNPAVVPNFATTEHASWSENGGAMAYILMRRPVRVAMYASALVAAEQS